MKYEAVFGNQELFDGASCAAIIVIKSNGNGRYTVSENECSDTVKLSVCQPNIEIAMRRIIQEPKRWTVEDQKAGRLPEVGCIVIGCDKKEYEVLAQERCELALRNTSNRNLMLITVSGFNRDFKPIETPEEKAERLRSEWVELAFDNMMRKEGLHSTECLDRVKCNFGSAYDALISGTLSAPTKGGE